ncbi:MULTISPECIES: MBL fold metallo-hydrolase [Acinetobacter Taxon 24D]|uniref:MBL fold metallo-hydrolase n=1 Tax=Acinetobacter Taxon 24D TaxID=2839057 RepID=UPI00148FAB80|nr:MULTISPECIES: MBL fold metallo-hydrolase [Acinetobacter Taxon 24D]NNG81203.1 Zn-dependent hydrolase [Acinetobacter sp. ANC 5378]NNH00555.1 Zn-dependent hydrolase [Acinetobacter sp. ANC 5414]
MKQKTEQLHFQLPTQDCWSHIWRQPSFKFMYSNHHNGERFLNILPRPEGPRRADLFKWLITRKSSTWKMDVNNNEYVESATAKRAIPQDRPEASIDDWQVWFVGHATVLLQIGPYNLLTDPVWGEYASPKQGKGPKRVIPAGIALEELPTIHAVLLSHNHYDHMDLATLQWLHDKFAMPIYTGLGNSWYLPKSFQVLEMDWWQSSLLHDLKIIYTPAQHFSGRGLRDQNRALWGGFSVLAGQDHCFFAGDTGYSPHFKEIQSRLGAPRISLLPIGSYEPRELMRYMHLNPQDAFQAHKDLHSKCSLAVHYRTFQLTDESREQPELDLKAAMKNTSKLMTPFICVREGRRLVV